MIMLLHLQSNNSVALVKHTCYSIHVIYRKWEECSYYKLNITSLYNFPCLTIGFVSTFVIKSVTVKACL
jgi:hypothetical protein